MVMVVPNKTCIKIISSHNVEDIERMYNNYTEWADDAGMREDGVYYSTSYHPDVPPNYVLHSLLIKYVPKIL